MDNLKLSIIIKLQNLPISASSLDIRRFFSGLSIYDGGVHVVGGSDGIAFIAFSNDEDARQAMAKNDSTIKGSKIKLFLSSRNEMKSVIDKARNQTVNLEAKTNAVLNQQSQTNGTSTSSSTNNPLGNRSSTNTFNNTQLTTNLPTLTKLDSKLNNSSQNQYDFNRQFTNDLSNLVTNLQEAPDYRRNRSSSPTKPLSALSKTNADDKSSAYSDQRVKKMLETVKNLDNLSNQNSNQNSIQNLNQNLKANLNTNLNANLNINANLNANQLNAMNSGSVRSRLGGFDLSNSNDLYVNNKTNGNSTGVPLLMTPKQTPQLNGRYDSPPNLSAMNSSNYDHSMLNHQPRFLLECGNLPPHIQIMDIQKFFRQGGVLLDQNQIKLSTDDRGYFTGLAHLVITNEQDLDNAMKLNEHFLEGFTIYINPMNLNPMNNKALLETPLGIQPSSNHNLMGQLNFLPHLHNDPNLIEHNDFFRKRNRIVYPLFMKGIPYGSCNQDEVAKFFEPIPCAEIVITIDRSGKPSGNAYVIFEELSDFEYAMRRNQRFMGRRYIELFPADLEEVEGYKMRALNGIVGDGNSPYGRKRRRSLDLDEHDNKAMSFCAQILGLPPAVKNKDITNYLLEKTGQSIQITAVHIMLKQDKTNAGECFVEFSNRESLNLALKQDGQRMGNYRLSVKFVNYEKMCRIVGLHKNRDDDKRSKFSKRESSSNRRLIVYARVSMKATVDDICDFFKEYKLRHNQVDFKLDQQGERGNELTIRFNSSRDADSAIRNYNNKFFIDNRIYLRHA